MICLDANDDRNPTCRRLRRWGGFASYDGSPCDAVIRYGANGHKKVPVYNARLVLNPRLILDKRRQYELMSNANVPIPLVFNNVDEWRNYGSPVVVIKPRRGTKGKGIIKTSVPIFSNRHIVQLYIEKSREFRVTMVDTVIAFLMEKSPPPDGGFKWNMARGSTWHPVPPDVDLRRNLRELGSRALRSIGYDFGGIDIMQDNDNNFYVLEVNSLPSAGETNAPQLAHALKTYIERRLAMDE